MDLHDSVGLGGMGPETVYGTHEDSHVVMSEKVQSLAGSIYQEFERMIASYDEDVVKTLMPLLVNVLECLDAAYQQNQEHDVELELLREDNEQLVTQYEREKSARKSSEQKLLEFEDAAEGERKELTARLEALESIVRMLELKNKNSMEYTGRLEEREGEVKKEYAKLHERYTELFKTHMDYMERTKMLLSGQQLANERTDVGRLNTNRINMGRSSGPISFGFASLENAEAMESVPSSPVSSIHSSPSLHSEMDNANTKEELLTVERAQETDAVNFANKSMVTSPVDPQEFQTNNNSRSHTKNEQRSANTLYQELSFQDPDVDEDSEITGGWVHPGEYASSGMGKEVENLIMENNELLATKNALNVVKDDLIVKVDELTGELEMLREEILSLNLSRTKLRERVSELEDEMKKVKEANEAKQEAGEEESDVPLAQRKRFTRVEMARVLMERNQYKERFMELQEAVRWTELIRASKSDVHFDKKQKQSIWKFFSNLFNAPERPPRSMAQPQMRYQTATNQLAPEVRALPRSGVDYIETEMGKTLYLTRAESFFTALDGMTELRFASFVQLPSRAVKYNFPHLLGQGHEKLNMRRAIEKRDQYLHVKAHVQKEDGRLHAYGWSLPSKGSGDSKGSHGNNGVPLPPVPVYCRPLTESTPGMNVWCATGVNLMGGYTRDGGLMVGGSVFYADGPKITEVANNEVDTLDQELKHCEQGALLETKLTSQVWICAFNAVASVVTVIDANNPAEILSSFGVSTSRVLCIASVPGASPNDYVQSEIVLDDLSDLGSKTSDNGVAEGSEEIPKVVTEGAKKIDKTAEELEEKKVLGRITFVEKNETAINKKIEYANLQKANSQELLDKTGKTSESLGEDSEDSHENPSQPPDIMSTVLATIWIGCETGMLYVHSSVANWNICLQSVKLEDAILSIVHVNGTTIVALASGKLVVFRRTPEGEWDLSKYYVVQIGLPHKAVRCLCVVADKVWCGYQNKVHVLQPKDLKIIYSLEAHPRRESPVRQMAWLGDGVWISIRLDSTLRLYHAHTYQHLQDVDIEPYVTKMLGSGKIGFTFVRITSLLISSNRLWIGTTNGVIISVPLSESTALVGNIVQRGGTSLPGSNATVRVPPPDGYIPYCSMAHAQLSFHGHRANVKFFVAVPGSGGMSAASTPAEALAVPITSNNTKESSSAMLVLSGGEGYIDFRIGDDMVESTTANESGELESNQNDDKLDKSYLIVWQVSSGN